MKQRLVSQDQVLAGYDAVSQLYPYVPSMNMWRAWELAAYRHYGLPEPVLDIGCGDGRFFRLVWPHIREVIGVDIDPNVVDAARQFGIYQAVHAVPAHHLPFAPGCFASAFANCSLEHMDHLPQVLNSIYNSLRPGGTFLFSVVTDKWHTWATLPLLLQSLGNFEQARSLQANYVAYHHLANALTPEGWRTELEQAGFEVLEHIPIAPEITSRLFLFLDHLWHVRQGTGELGDMLYPYFSSMPDLPQAFRKILSAVLELEHDWVTCSGAVFFAQRERCSQ